jgi:hypothetical protein
MGAHTFLCLGNCSEIPFVHALIMPVIVQPSVVTLILYCLTQGAVIMVPLVSSQYRTALSCCDVMYSTGHLCVHEYCTLV